MKKKFACGLLLTAICVSACTFNNPDKDESPNQIVVTVIPADGIVYNGVETSVSATFSESMQEVSFYFNGQGIGSIIAAPYTVFFTPKDTSPGVSTITCIARDSAGSSYTGQADVQVVLRLGDEYQGGRIFSLDESGTHGLVAATEDMCNYTDIGTSYGFEWAPTSAGRLGTSMDDGPGNTALMAAAATSDSYAGYFFKNGYLYNGYSNWYIPSNDELELLKDNQIYVGGFVESSTNWENFYWSSSESSIENYTYAFCLDFFALAGNYSGKWKNHKVRVIHDF